MLTSSVAQGRPFCPQARLQGQFHDVVDPESFAREPQAPHRPDRRLCRSYGRPGKGPPSPPKDCVVLVDRPRVTGCPPSLAHVQHQHGSDGGDQTPEHGPRGGRNCHVDSRPPEHHETCGSVSSYRRVQHGRIAFCDCHHCCGPGAHYPVWP